MRNRVLAEKVKALAEEKGIAPAQLALAWCGHQAFRPRLGHVLRICEPGFTRAPRAFIDAPFAVAIVVTGTLVAVAPSSIPGLTNTM